MLIDIRDIYKIYNEGKESEVRALDGVSLQIIHGDMLFLRCFRCSRNDLLHFFTAAIYRNTFVTDHRNDIAAMSANIEFLFRGITSFSGKYIPFS